MTDVDVHVIVGVRLLARTDLDLHTGSTGGSLGGCAARRAAVVRGGQGKVRERQRSWQQPAACAVLPA